MVKGRKINFIGMVWLRGGVDGSWGCYEMESNVIWRIGKERGMESWDRGEW